MANDNLLPLVDVTTANTHKTNISTKRPLLPLSTNKLIYSIYNNYKTLVRESKKGKK